MFDYQTSKHAHFDAACRAFAIEHNLEDVAAAVGMRPQILRNKLNPAQPHRLTCDELLAITDYTEDARLLDGMLAKSNCTGCEKDIALAWLSELTSDLESKLDEYENKTPSNGGISGGGSRFQ